MSVVLPIKSFAASYATPSTMDEALELARAHRGGYEYSAGGTDLQLLRQQELHSQPVIIDLCGVLELQGVRVTDGSLEIGALEKLDELLTAPAVKQTFPLLVEAALSVATPVIRKTATLGGNLLVSNRCSYYNQSKAWRTAVGSCLRDVGDTCLVTGVKNGKCFSRHVSDMAPALIALDAEVTIRNQHSTFSIPLSQLYVQDGIRCVSRLEEDGILLKIRISSTVKKWWYRKLRLRQSLDFTSLTIAACADSEGMIRICLNGVAMAPVLIAGRKSELTLEGVVKQARLKAKVVNNDFLPLSYRQDMMTAYLEELWDDFQS